MFVHTAVYLPAIVPAQLFLFGFRILQPQVFLKRDFALVLIEAFGEYWFAIFILRQACTVLFKTLFVFGLYLAEKLLQRHRDCRCGFGWLGVFGLVLSYHLLSVLHRHDKLYRLRHCCCCALFLALGFRCAFRGSLVAPAGVWDYPLVYRLRLRVGNGFGLRDFGGFRRNGFRLVKRAAALVLQDFVEQEHLKAMHVAPLFLEAFGLTLDFALYPRGKMFLQQQH